MSLLIVTAEFPFGRGEGFLEHEIRALAAEGPRVFVVPLRWWARKKRDVLPDSIDVVLLPPLSVRGLARLFGEVMRNPGRLARVVHLLARDPRHFAKNLLTIPSALAIACFVRERKIDHIHAHWLATSATAAMVAAIWSESKFSITTHRWDIFDGNLASAKLERAQFVRFISESGRRAWLRLRPGSEDKLVLLRMGVQLPPERATLPEGEPFKIGCPANLIPVKGHEDLLRAVAAARAKDLAIELWIIGEGELRRTLEELAVGLGLGSACRFTGQLAHDELLSLYKDGKFHCVVLPSRDLGNGLHEGIPISLMEAMSFGIPVIATRTGGIGELVRDRIDGLLVEGGDPEGLSDRIIELATDRDLRERLARAGRERIKAEFNVREVGQKLFQLLDRGVSVQ